METKEPIVITLDGNIGAGKSTLMLEARKAFPDIEIVVEPVGEWLSTRDENGKNILELFYEDKKRWAYTFQNLTILSRLKQIRDTLATTTKRVVIVERSVLTDRYVFAEMLRNDGLMDSLEYSLYLKWFDQFASELPLKAMIHLTTGVVTSSARIKKRGRDGESSIPTDYLDALEKQHQNWISNTEIPVLQLSTEDDIPVEANLMKIQQFVDELIADADRKDTETSEKEPATFFNTTPFVPNKAAVAELEVKAVNENEANLNPKTPHDAGTTAGAQHVVTL
jgi:deoxyadenosine/deoxycytidine kinase